MPLTRVVILVPADCDGSRYSLAFNTAIVMLFVWPCGIPVMYLLLLLACRDAIRNHTPTPLMRATSFLSGDCVSLRLDPPISGLGCSLAVAHTFLLSPTQSSQGRRPLLTDKKSMFWWEPLEMCRKLALTVLAARIDLLPRAVNRELMSPRPAPICTQGWVLLISEDFEQARVLVALLVSITFFGLHLSIRPLRR